MSLPLRRRSAAFPCGIAAVPFMRLRRHAAAKLGFTAAKLIEK